MGRFPLQGFRYRSTTCLWSVALSGLAGDDALGTTQGLRPVGLYHLPVVCRPFRAYLVRASVGASLGWATVAQGLRYRSTACPWSVALSGLAWCGHLSGLRLIGCSHYTGVLPCRATPPACGLLPLRGSLAGRSDAEAILTGMPTTKGAARWACFCSACCRA